MAHEKVIAPRDDVNVRVPFIYLMAPLPEYIVQEYFIRGET